MVVIIVIISTTLLGTTKMKEKDELKDNLSFASTFIDSIGKSSWFNKLSILPWLNNI